jgi:hypothetical protein
MLLINKQQVLVCDYLLDRMSQSIQACKPSFLSMTYVPYYDSSIINAKKNLLG